MHAYPLRPFGALALMVLAAATGAAQGQHPTATNVPVEGHFAEPAKLEPTDERIATLHVPAGFRVRRFAELANPRMIAVAPNGDIYVTQRESGTLVLLRDTDADGVADVQRVVAERKNLHGVALGDGKIYLAAIHEVFVADIRPDGTLGELRTIVSDLPDAGQHPNRTIAIGPDGMLYISVGSTCNVCDEPTANPNMATLQRAKPDGTGRTIVASGLRNTIGFGWHPASKRLFGMDHGIDWLGDEDQPEELNEIVEGKRYGWPYVYGDGKLYPRLDPPKGTTKKEWAATSERPRRLYTPHAAPMQMAFYTGSTFPAEYRGDAFVAMHGSWNRRPPSGYEVVRVRFDPSGAPTAIEPFLTGFLTNGGEAQFGRPVGVAVAADGALLVGDDTNNVVYRITYEPSAKADAASLFPRTITSTLPEFAKAPATIAVRSDAFGANGPIPERNSEYGAGESPALSWSNVPSGAKSLVLMAEDPDSASPKPVTHWLVANVPATAKGLPAALSKGDTVPGLSGAMQGAPTPSAVGYYGPKPPAGDPDHHYHFQVFALDTTLDLHPGFNRQAILKAMRGHVLARGELVGTFRRE